MKMDPAGPESRWEKLVSQARKDAPPPIDTAALMRAVRNASPQQEEGWVGAFVALFSTRSAAWCSAAACAAVAALTAWEAIDVWQVIAWANLITVATGGVS